MLCIIFALSVSIVTVGYADQTLICSKGWHQLDSSCYKILPNRLTHDEARIECRRFNNSLLLTFRTIDERRLMSEFLFGSLAVRGNIWLGAKSRSEFVHDDGSIVHASVMPDVRYEGCLIIKQNRSLAEEPCTETNLAVCQMHSQTHVEKTCQEDVVMEKIWSKINSIDEAQVRMHKELMEYLQSGRGFRPCERLVDHVADSCKINRTTIIDPILEDAEVNIVLKPGQAKNVTFTFLNAETYFDVYFLTDITGSMSDDRDNLVRLADQLADTFDKISSNYHIGMGSFADKAMSGLGDSTDKVFVNRLPLTSDSKAFKEAVKALEIRGGGDGPEAAFEAMIQATVCEEAIGWRSNARKLLLVITDAVSHVAGDSSLSTKNDGKCHLDEQGVYTKDLVFDYPSAEDVVEILESNTMTTIFAVTADVTEFYRKVSTNLKASAVGVLASDSSNIVQVITEKYNEVRSRVEIQVTSDDLELFDVTFFSDCGGLHEMRQTQFCENIPFHQEVTFTAAIGLRECPEKKHTEQIKMSPVGVPAYLNINAKLNC